MELIWKGGELVSPQPDLFLGWQPCSGSFGTSGIVTAAGVSSTAGGSESPRGGGGYSACSLAQTLESEGDWLARNAGKGRADWLAYLRKYYLSPTACAGILRRAEARGRSLPAALEQALRAVAGDATPGPGPTDHYIQEGEA
jgi:hypothetical protein